MPFTSPRFINQKLQFIAKNSRLKIAVFTQTPKPAVGTLFTAAYSKCKSVDAMKKPQLLIVVILGMLGCSPENEKSRNIDKELLEVTKEHEMMMRKNIDDANVVLDTISVLADLPKHVRGEKLVDRLKAVHQYIVEMEEKLEKTEGALKNSRVQASAYMMMADAYKGEVEILNEELQMLSDSISEYQSRIVAEPIARRY